MNNPKTESLSHNFCKYQRKKASVRISRKILSRARRNRLGRVLRISLFQTKNSNDIVPPTYYWPHIISRIERCGCITRHQSTMPHFFFPSAIHIFLLFLCPFRFVRAISRTSEAQFSSETFITSFISRLN